MINTIIFFSSVAWTVWKSSVSQTHSNGSTERIKLSRIHRMFPMYRTKFPSEVYVKQILMVKNSRLLSRGTDGRAMIAILTLTNSVNSIISAAVTFNISGHPLRRWEDRRRGVEDRKADLIPAFSFASLNEQINLVRMWSNRMLQSERKRSRELERAVGIGYAQNVTFI